MRFGINSSTTLLVLLGLTALSACKKDDPATPPPPPPPAATYTVGGTLAGLTGSVTLANNGGDARTLTANGAFSFATALLTAAAYNVTVTSQPANQTCTVGAAAGTVASSNVSTVTVTCVTNTFLVGGTVTGLAGTGLVLQNNAADNLARAADGAFTFATAVTSGGAYNVTVLTQPTAPAQTCAATNNTGNVAANVTTVTITCVNNPTTVGSAVIGPAGGTVNGFYGAQIIVPPGALATPVTIGLARDSSNSPDFAVPDVDAVGATYELTPHGQAFYGAGDGAHSVRCGAGFERCRSGALQGGNGRYVRVAAHHRERQLPRSHDHEFLVGDAGVRRPLGRAWCTRSRMPQAR